MIEALLFIVHAIQVWNAQQLYTVSVARLPGGKAVDYVEHFVSTVNCLAQTYSAYCGDEELLVSQNTVHCSTL